MSEYVINKQFSNSGTRNDVRMRVVNEFSNEPAGKGSGDKVSRYTYYVEQLEDGNRVYLRRPANLHFGFDFVVCVENYDFRKPGKKRKINYPAHGDIISDLISKKTDNPDGYADLYRLMRQVYECNDINDSEIKELPPMVGYPCDMLLKTLKWLFIEQDIRYWNYSGREMLWGGIPKP